VHPLVYSTWPKVKANSLNIPTQIPILLTITSIKWKKIGNLGASRHFSIQYVVTKSKTSHAEESQIMTDADVQAHNSLLHYGIIDHR